jgi:hypothetical protein
MHDKYEWFKQDVVSLRYPYSSVLTGPEMVQPLPQVVILNSNHSFTTSPQYRQNCITQQCG